MQEVNEKIIIDDMPKIKWACRRGMLELDVILGKFLEIGYPQLAIADKKLFIELLSYSDPELFNWLLAHATPNNADLVKIVNIIRQYVRSRI